MVSEDIFKTPLHNGHYEFLIIPIGLSNAPTTFQSLMNDIFQDYFRKIILVFFYDILIYSKNMTEHLHHLRLFFELLFAH